MDYKQIQTIIKDFEKSNMTNLEIETADFKIKLSKNNEHSELKTVSSDQQILDDALCEIRAPLVGTFYTIKQGEELIKVGDRVVEGQVLCIVEAMKIMNEIAAPQNGIVENIHLNNGDAVGFNQVIITLREE
jgi:biotin carboxyl carrier protein